MNAELTISELETISKMVSDKIYSKIIADSSQKELQKACENYTNKMISFYLKENAVSYDVAKMIKPFFDEYLKNSNIIETQLRSYMTSEQFKKIELRNLELRVQQLRDELENEKY